MSQDEIIDLNKLTTKELMVRMLDRFGGIEKDLDELKEELKANDEHNINVLLKINTLEAKVKAWGALFGIGAAIVIELIMRIIE